MTTEQHLELVKLMEIALKKCNWLVKEEFRTVLHELTVRQHMFITEDNSIESLDLPDYSLAR